MTTNALSAASLAIYILLLQPTLYILYRHGWPGFLGWFYLQLFCILRIVSNALALSAPLDPVPLAGSSSNSGSSTGTLIVSNVGLSPLLLATAGILHEARRASAAGGTWKSTWEWHIVIHYHFLVSGALALIVAGVVLLEQKNTTIDTYNTAASLIKAGSAVVLICWALLTGYTGWTLLRSRGAGVVDTGALDYRAGRKLLYAVIIALPLIALRLSYGVASLLLTVTGHLDNAFLTSLAAKVILGTVPEMILVIVFILAGIATQNIAGSFWSKSSVRRGDAGVRKAYVGVPMEERRV